jgi:hypothetical protein
MVGRRRPRITRQSSNHTNNAAVRLSRGKGERRHGSAGNPSVRLSTGRSPQRNMRHRRQLGSIRVYRPMQRRFPWRTDDGAADERQPSPERRHPARCRRRPSAGDNVEATLVGAGALVVAVCRTLDEAMARGDADDFAVAVLDFGLGSDTVAPFARRLSRQGIPFVLHTECREVSPV